MFILTRKTGSEARERLGIPKHSCTARADFYTTLLGFRRTDVRKRAIVLDLLEASVTCCPLRRDWFFLNNQQENEPEKGLRRTKNGGSVPAPEIGLVATSTWCGVEDTRCGTENIVGFPKLSQNNLLLL
ncbi:hypothetical protein NPIL_255221 [Nephila pilipes]|uniref:Uncharacterized protein n=1 Tax=Nephila pilipes TaxID=299642 RepID=A0A8X6TFR9_NEPPI|nr:hypothetical protein NPIL_255221 [Nephila pilipes]